MAEPSWQAVAALADPVRRALYDHVRSQDHPVTREQAAAAVSISRGLAAFHLDKLVETGLLRAGYPPVEPGSRGRGRAPKTYEVVGELAVTIPPRRYELVGAILADAVATAPTDARATALAEATRHGRRMGRQLRPAPGPAAEDAAVATPTPSTTADSFGAVRPALVALGFEPRLDGPARLLLDNCPFHALAAAQPELVCGLNLAFLDGLLGGLDAAGVRTRLAPRPGACCVELTAVPPAGPGDP